MALRDDPLHHVGQLLLGLMALVAIFPLALMLLNSLKAQVEISANPLALPSAPQWSNYLRAWQSGRLGPALANSARVALVTVLLTCASASGAAYALARRAVPGWAALSVYFLALTTVPIHLFIFPLYFIVARLNLLNNPYALAVIYSALYTPFAIFLLRTYVLAFPEHLEEAARIDGANNWQLFYHIVLPLLAPGLLTVALITALYSWNEFLLAVTFLQQPQARTAMVQFFMFSGQRVSDWGVMMAAATIIAAPMVLLFVALQQRFIEGIASGAVKG